MPDDEKPFVCTKGSVHFNITPRNRTGWIYLGLWTVPIVAAASAYSWVVDASGLAASEEAIAVAGLVAMLVLWCASMVRWMYNRSVLIDVRDLDRLNQDAKRGRRRKRP